MILQTRTKQLLWAFACAAALVFAACKKQPAAVIIKPTPAQTAEDAVAPVGNHERHTIYLITMDLEDIHWKSIDTGCRKAVDELGNINYKWIAPDLHDDEQQMVCIEEAISGGAEAIVISPTSAHGVNKGLEKADKAGIKIVYVDSTASYPAITAFGTNNAFAGETAGETLRKALADAGITSGRIGIFVNKQGTASTTARQEGFRRVFAGTAFELAETVYMNDEPPRIKAAVLEQKDAVAFFATSERTTLAAGEQVSDSGMNQIIVGFDSSDAVLSLVSKGVIHAVMQQRPQEMGYRGMKAAYQILEGTYTAPENKAAAADTGVSVIDRAAL